MNECIDSRFVFSSSIGFKLDWCYVGIFVWCGACSAEILIEGVVVFLFGGFVFLGFLAFM